MACARAIRTRNHSQRFPRRIAVGLDAVLVCIDAPQADGARAAVHRSGPSAHLIVQQSGLGLDLAMIDG